MPGVLQSMEAQRVGYDWRLNNHNFSIMDKCDVIKNVTWPCEGNAVPSVRGKRILTKTCRTLLIFSGRKQMWGIWK